MHDVPQLGLAQASHHVPLHRHRRGEPEQKGHHWRQSASTAGGICRKLVSFLALTALHHIPQLIATNFYQLGAPVHNTGSVGMGCHIPTLPQSGQRGESENSLQLPPTPNLLFVDGVEGQWVQFMLHVIPPTSAALPAPSVLPQNPAFLKGEHVSLVCLYPRLVKGIYAQQVTADSACFFKEVQ